MSVNRRDLIKHLEKYGYFLRREGGNHSIYSNGEKMIPVKRHRTMPDGAGQPLDNVTANAICRQAGVPAIF